MGDDREALWGEYVERVPYQLYPVQEEAVLQWFTAEQGVLVCAPTGTGKTLIAEAAVYEALRTGRRLYYTTPLIALTDQKLQELRRTAVRWGFPESSIGLVTGNRRVEPDAPVLVVVAEILMNRLMHPEAFDFRDVSAVVMDEFHSFNEPERGIVWELSLALLPKAVRTMLLSATVGNAYEFCSWLRTRHDRDLALVTSDRRQVPLTFHWIGDVLLGDHMERMYQGGAGARLTPALVFCFNRDECWTVAQELRGRGLVDSETQRKLSERLSELDLSYGAGPTLKPLLQRGIGVHHAGVLPRHRRIVETLFEERLLSVVVCTETLAAGINLPARSVVLPSLVKGAAGNRKLVDASSAHQMFGRAGRPQYDDHGDVFILAHEDDVRIAKWREKYDQIPEDTKDPGLIKAKKALKKKMPRRRETETYWTREQFEQLRDAPPSRLSSRGGLPWRMLAFLLQANPEIEPIRKFVAKRLLPAPRIEEAQRELHRMLMLLSKAGHVRLDPPLQEEAVSSTEMEAVREAEEVTRPTLTFGGRVVPAPDASASGERRGSDRNLVWPISAIPEASLAKFASLRSVHPMYGLFLVEQLDIADDRERLQAFESLLELPLSLGPAVRVPWPDRLPQGPLALERLNDQLLQSGLASPEELMMKVGGDDEESAEDGRSGRGVFDEPPVRPLVLAEKLRRLFDHEFPGAGPLRTTPVWVAGELLELGGDFERYVTSHRLQKQEGVVFRHLLRLVLLLRELADVPPATSDPETWRADLCGLADRLTQICRQVDPESTDQVVLELEN